MLTFATNLKAVDKYNKLLAFLFVVGNSDYNKRTRNKVCPKNTKKTRFYERFYSVRLPELRPT